MVGFWRLKSSEIGRTVAKDCSGAGVYVCYSLYAFDDIIEAEDDSPAGAGKTVLA